MLATAICLVALILAGWAIAKNYDAKVVLFATGIVLMYCALILGIIVNVILKPGKAEVTKEVSYDTETEDTMFGVVQKEEAAKDLDYLMFLDNESGKAHEIG